MSLVENFKMTLLGGAGTQQFKGVAIDGVNTHATSTAERWCAKYIQDSFALAKQGEAHATVFVGL